MSVQAWLPGERVHSWVGYLEMVLFNPETPQAGGRTMRRSNETCASVDGGGVFWGNDEAPSTADLKKETMNSGRSCAGSFEQSSWRS